jgi:hypothetical protein
MQKKNKGRRNEERGVERLIMMKDQGEKRKKEERKEEKIPTDPIKGENFSGC